MNRRDQNSAAWSATWNTSHANLSRLARAFCTEFASADWVFSLKCLAQSVAEKYGYIIVSFCSTSLWAVFMLIRRMTTITTMVWSGHSFWLLTKAWNVLSWLKHDFASFCEQHKRPCGEDAITRSIKALICHIGVLRGRDFFINQKQSLVVAWDMSSISYSELYQCKPFRIDCTNCQDSI